MADRAVPDLDMTVGYHLEDAQGQLVWDVYQGQPNTWKLALIDLLKNPRLRSLYFLTGGISELSPHFVTGENGSGLSHVGLVGDLLPILGWVVWN